MEHASVEPNRSARQARRTILIVDDHADFRRVVRVALQAEGFLVVGDAIDGATAISESARLRPQLVLMDIGLPDIDGFAVATRLAEQPDAPAVILISSREAREYGPRIAEASARGFITKGQLTGAAIDALMNG